MIAFIRPKRRKGHLATTVGDTWQPLCNVNPAPVDGTDFLSIDAAYNTVSVDDESVCTYCLRLIAFAHIIDTLATGNGGRHLKAAS